MNTFVKDILLFAGGALAGSAVVFFGMKYKMEADYSKRLDVEVAETKRHYTEMRERYAEMAATSAEISAVHDKDISKEEAKVYEILADHYKASDTKDVVNYDRPVRTEEVAPKDEKTKKSKKDSKPVVPYQISKKEFDNGYDTIGYDSLMMIRFDDEIVSWDDGSYVDDILRYVGSAGKEALDKGLKDHVYIRNPILERDYDIAHEHCTYDAYFGVVDY